MRGNQFTKSKNPLRFKHWLLYVLFVFVLTFLILGGTFALKMFTEDYFWRQHRRPLGPALDGGQVRDQHRGHRRQQRGQVHPQPHRHRCRRHGHHRRDGAADDDQQRSAKM